ncbi:capsid protein [Billgrantia azerbaijanica]|nr:capsid protein [Halomonas azerbaijanica]
MNLKAHTKKHLDKAISLANRGKVQVATATGLALAGIGTAHASGSGSGASAAFGELQSQAESFANDAWPVVIAVVGGLVAISMFKKFASRAS